MPISSDDPECKKKYDHGEDSPLDDISLSAIPPIDIVVVGEVLGSVIVPALKRIPHETRHIGDKKSFFRIGCCVCLLIFEMDGNQPSTRYAERYSEVRTGDWKCPPPLKFTVGCQGARC